MGKRYVLPIFGARDLNRIASPLPGSSYHRQRLDDLIAGG